ncbi:Uncharacterized protein APZ42_003089, partial [Daphnia magna]
FLASLQAKTTIFPIGILSRWAQPAHVYTTVFYDISLNRWRFL